MESRRREDRWMMARMEEEEEGSERGVEREKRSGALDALLGVRRARGGGEGRGGGERRWRRRSGSMMGWGLEFDIFFFLTTHAEAKRN